VSWCSPISANIVPTVWRKGWSSRVEITESLQPTGRLRLCFGKAQGSQATGLVGGAEKEDPARIQEHWHRRRRSPPKFCRLSRLSGETATSKNSQLSAVTRTGPSSPSMTMAKPSGPPGIARVIFMQCSGTKAPRLTWAPSAVRCSFHLTSIIEVKFVGYAVSSNGTYLVFLWQNGVATELGTLPLA